MLWSWVYTTLTNQLSCISDIPIHGGPNSHFEWRIFARIQWLTAEVQRSVQKFLKDHGRDGVALLPANPAVPKNTVYSNGVPTSAVFHWGQHV